MFLILFKNCKFILYIYSYSEDLEQNTKRKFFFHASPKKKRKHEKLSVGRKFVWDTRQKTRFG